MERPSGTWLGTAGAAWGLVGVAVVLGGGVASLGPHVLALHPTELSGIQLAALAPWLAFMAYGKGYRGMHRAFVPSILARARALRAAPRVATALLAPLYCMRLVAAPPRTMALSWAFIAVIVGLILAIRHLPPPWREGVDAGVALGLAMGLASLALGVAGWLARRG